MENPKAALDALLEAPKEVGRLVVHPLTVARYALLELLESPLVTGDKIEVMNIIPSIYVMTQDISRVSHYNSSSIQQLKDAAFEWAEDGLVADGISLVLNEMAQKILDLRRLAPEAVEDSKKKLLD